MKLWNLDEFEAVRWNEETVETLLLTSEGLNVFRLLQLVLMDTNGRLEMCDLSCGIQFKTVIKGNKDRLCLKGIYRAPGDWAPMLTSAVLDANVTYRRAFIRQAWNRDCVVRFQLRNRAPDDRVIKFVYPGSQFLGVDIRAGQVLADNPVPNDDMCGWASAEYGMTEVTKEAVTKEIENFKPSYIDTIRKTVEKMVLEEQAPKERKLPVIEHDGLLMVEYRGKYVSLTATESIKTFVAWELEGGERFETICRAGHNVAKYVIVKE